MPIGNEQMSVPGERNQINNLILTPEGQKKQAEVLQNSKQRRDALHKSLDQQLVEDGFYKDKNGEWRKDLLDSDTLKQNYIADNEKKAKSDVSGYFNSYISLKSNTPLSGKTKKVTYMKLFNSQNQLVDSTPILQYENYGKIPDKNYGKTAQKIFLSTLLKNKNAWSYFSPEEKNYFTKILKGRGYKNVGTTTPQSSVKQKPQGVVPPTFTLQQPAKSPPRITIPPAKVKTAPVPVPRSNNQPVLKSVEGNESLGDLNPEFVAFIKQVNEKLGSNLNPKQLASLISAGKRSENMLQNFANRITTDKNNPVSVPPLYVDSQSKNGNTKEYYHDMIGKEYLEGMSKNYLLRQAMNLDIEFEKYGGKKKGSDDIDNYESLSKKDRENIQKLGS